MPDPSGLGAVPYRAAEYKDGGKDRKKVFIKEKTMMKKKCKQRYSVMAALVVFVALALSFMMILTGASH